MTDDQTQPIETPMPAGTAAIEPDRVDAVQPEAGMGSFGPASSGRVSAPSGAGRMRWAVALGVTGLAVAVAIGAVALLGAPASPEALRYIPGDAALVAELRLDLPGDQMENLGDLLAHFPGFQDQSTLPQKIDEALSRLVAMSGADHDYATDVKPYLAGPTFAAVRSLAGASESGDVSNALLVATTNGAVTCATAFEGQTPTHETYRGIDISKAGSDDVACAVDGRFFLVGDLATLKLGLDAHADGTGIDKSPRYSAARSQLGLDRLATLYVDGRAIGAMLSDAASTTPFVDLAAALPEWFAAGLRAEGDALVFDTVVAAVALQSPAPGTRTLPPAHPIALAQLAPADTLLFLEAQGIGVSLHNALGQLSAMPELAEPLAMLDQIGGLDGLVGWIDDLGLIVVPDGDLVSGALLLVASDAASATEKVTAVTTILQLGALGGDVDVSVATVEGVEVTTVHIPDAGSLLGDAVPGTAVPAVPLDFSVAVRDRVVYFGIGEGIMPRILGVKSGASLVDDAAYQRAIGRSLANPQTLLYLAAGAGLDLVEKALPASDLATWTADVKPYLDPFDAVVFSAAGNGSQGSVRLALTVANP